MLPYIRRAWRFIFCAVVAEYPESHSRLEISLLSVQNMGASWRKQLSHMPVAGGRGPVISRAPFLCFFLFRCPRPGPPCSRPDVIGGIGLRAFGCTDPSLMAAGRIVPTASSVDLLSNLDRLDRLVSSCGVALRRSRNCDRPGGNASSAAHPAWLP